MTLRAQLAPFLGKHCIYDIPEDSQQPIRAIGLKIPDGKLRLFIFDWKKLDDDVREQIAEKAGQDDYNIFALVNGNPEAESLEELLEAKHQGFLMYAEDNPGRVYLGDGEMNTFTTRPDEFIACLTAR